MHKEKIKKKLNLTDNYIVFGEKKVEKKVVLVAMPLIVSLLFGLTCLLIQPVTTANKIIDSSINQTHQVVYKEPQTNISVASTHDLIQKLKEKNLWEVALLREIPPIIFSNYPSNFHTLEDMVTRKKAFLHTLLPTALVALKEVREEKKRLNKIISTINIPLEAIHFSIKNKHWQPPLSSSEINFIIDLTQKYKTKKAQKLLNRVDVVPISLILGQSAIESSWGGSRFARIGNNLFGIWTWKEKGIIPNEREEGMTHKVRIYDSILDSVRSYILTLNRVPAYKQFRKLRKLTNDSIILAQGLLLYSARRELYVQEVRSVISKNNLQNYDHFLLAGREPDSYFSANKQSYLLYNNDKL